MSSIDSPWYSYADMSGTEVHTANIKDRVSRGIGIVARIIKMLESISLGTHYFSIAFLLRESLLLNSILTNSFVWYNLKKSEIEDLERIDKSLLVYIFQTKFTVPTISLFLEGGLLRIRTILKLKRIMFLFYLPQQPSQSMLNQFFLAQ